MRGLYKDIREALRMIWMKYGKKAVVLGILQLAVVAYVTGFLYRYFTSFSFSEGVESGILTCIFFGITRMFLLTSLITAAIIFFEIRRYMVYVSKDPETMVSFESVRTKPDGAEFASGVEIARHFDVCEPGSLSGIPVGWDGRDRVYCFKEKRYDFESKEYVGDQIVGVQQHIAVIGKSGTGKTFTFLVNAIYECIHMGYSAFVTDPSGELYETTSEIARKNGVRIRLFHIGNAEGFALSDGFNPIHDINGSSLKAHAVSKVICENGIEASEIYPKVAETLLAFLILYVDSPPGKDRMSGIEFLENCNLGRVKEIMAHGMSYIMGLIRTMKPEHPGYEDGMTFYNYSLPMREAALTNLSAAMQMFTDDTVKEMTTYHDIDMTLPGREQCIYYLVISDIDRAFDFMSALFYDAAFTELKAEAVRNDDRALKRKVKFILEEFPSVGYINKFSGVVSNFRKYNMDVIMCCQNIPQLEERGYLPNIMDAFDTVLFLGTNLAENADFMRERIGKTYHEEVSVRESRSRITHIRSLDYQETKQEREKDLMTLNDILVNLNRGTDSALKEIVLKYRCAPFVCLTFPRTMNPLESERKDVKIYDHKPEYKTYADKPRTPYEPTVTDNVHKDDGNEQPANRKNGGKGGKTANGNGCFNLSQGNISNI